MVTVHNMPPKNQFLTGSCWEYDKFSYQNEPQTITMLDFNSDCPFDLLGEKSYSRVTSIFNGAAILYNTPKKQNVGPMFCTEDFDANGRRNTNFVHETSKCDKFMLIFTSYSQFYERHT